jgi:hypothetical protein
MRLCLCKRFGHNTGGMIAVDHKGKFGIACNTKSMPTALLTGKDEKTNIAFEYNYVMIMKSSHLLSTMLVISVLK